MLELHVLGPPRIVYDDRPVTGFISNKALVLLCYLALNHGSQSRTTLAALLWGKLPQKRARISLRVALHNLKKLLPGYLEMTRKTAAFRHERPHWIDVAEFERAGDSANDMENLKLAADWYRDTFLAGIGVDSAPSVDVWLRAERERYRLQLLGILDRLGKQYASHGRWQEAAEVARQLIRLEPWREESHRQLMLVLARQGKHNAALVQYERCRQVLEEELGVEPMPKTQRLHRRIQALRVRPQSHLPLPSTPFVGRQRERQALTERLIDPACRLLTLHGPGGIGKTRLALVVAQNVAARFLDGVAYASLSDVETEQHLFLAIADAVDFSFEGQQPYEQQLLAHLRPQERLLVLDDFERFLEGSAFVQRLITDTPNVKVIATSRIVLNCHGEWPFEVGGLELPPTVDETPDETGAVRLFMQHARRAGRDLALDDETMQVIIRICRLVDGMPLAIEHVASWLRTLTPQQLLHELNRGLDFVAYASSGNNHRHRSIRAVLKQSWRLLGEDERCMFRCLSVFRGGFTREAVLRVAGGSIGTLAALVDHSMLRLDGEYGRYEIHNLLRQFGAEQLAADETAETAARRRHAAYYAGFLAKRAEALHGPRQKQTIDEIRRELPNLRVAWNYVLSEAKPKLARSFVRGFWSYYELSGRYQEGLELYREAVASLRSDPEAYAKHPLYAGQILSCCGWFLFRTGAYREAVGVLQKGVALLRSDESRESLAWPLFYLGFASHLIGRYVDSEALIRESIEVHQAQENTVGLAYARSALAFIWLATGKLADTQRLIGEIVTDVGRSEGDRLVSNIWYLQGLAALAAGEPDVAEEYFKQALDISRAIDDTWNVALVSHYLGLAASSQGNLSGAKALHQDSLSLMQSLEEQLGIAYCLIGLGWAEQGLDNRQVALSHFCGALSIAADIGVLPQVLEAIAGIAVCRLVSGENARAAELLTVVAAHPSSAHPVRTQARLLLEQAGSELSPLSEHASSARLAHLVAEITGEDVQLLKTTP